MKCKVAFRLLARLPRLIWWFGIPVVVDVAFDFFIPWRCVCFCFLRLNLSLFSDRRAGRGSSTGSPPRLSTQRPCSTRTSSCKSHNTTRTSSCKSHNTTRPLPVSLITPQGPLYFFLISWFNSVRVDNFDIIRNACIKYIYFLSLGSKLNTFI